MAQIAAGLVTEDEVGGQPFEGKPGMLDTPAGWATFWFILSVIYLVGIYYGMIRVRGAR